MADPNGDAGEFRRGWPVVLAALLGIGLGLSPVPFYTIGSFAPELARAFGWGFGKILGGVTVTTVVVVVISPLVGVLVDRFGVRRVALVSVVLFSLSFMGFALSTGSLLLFYANWALVAALGAGTLPVTWTRAVNNRFDVHKGLALGLSLMGSGLFGYLIKPFTASIIAHHGWRAAYVAIGALPLLIALPVAILAFHDAGPVQNTASNRASAREARQASTPGLTPRQAYASSRFWLMAAAFMPISFAVGGPIPNLENMLRLAHFNAGQVVGLTSLIGLSVIIGRTLGGWLIDQFWAPAVALALLGVPAAACWVLAAGPTDNATNAAAILCIGFAAGIEVDLMAFMVSRYFGMKHYGAIYGSLYAFFAMGGGVAPLVFGLMFDRTGSYALILHISSALLMAGALLLLRLGKYPSPEQWPSSA